MDTTSSTATCNLCNINEDNPIELGEIMRKSRIHVHYYCLLLSTNLHQKGKNDSSGILGFLLHDIRNEIQESRKRICHYCNKTHATVKCRKCDIYYHVACGVRNDCLFEFIDEFHSYCHQHHGITHEVKHDDFRGCHICLRKMGPYNPLTSITGKCCGLICWVHRHCIKQYALSAGYYLQCLWCKSKEFRNDVRRLGVFVPDRDAKWERENGAFKELYQRYSKCDANKCLCDNGREFVGVGKWKILVCNSCAASGMHRACLSKSKKSNDFQCANCKEILQRTLHSSQVYSQQRVLFQTSEETNNRERVNTSSVSINKSQQSCQGAKSIDASLFMCKSQLAVYDEQLNIKDYNAERNPTSNNRPAPLPDYSKCKPYFCLYPEETAKLEYILLDAKDNIIKSQTNTPKPEFDDEFINELVKEAKSNHALHNKIIDVSESDDSDKSVTDLFNAMERKVNVPKPKIMPANQRNNIRKQDIKFLAQEFRKELSTIASSSNSFLFPVSPSVAMNQSMSQSNVSNKNGIASKSQTPNKLMSLEEKISHYFQDYREGSPDD